MFRRYEGVRVNEWHMVFPSCGPDCTKNGIKEAILRGSLHLARCYGSDNDSVVKWGHRLTGWMKLFGMGYGSASYAGLTNRFSGTLGRAENIRIDQWGHSDFASPGRLVPFLLEHVLRASLGGAQSGC
jgi:hypothetical protein